MTECKQVLQFYHQEDTNLQVVWEVYQLMHDNDDFLESLKVLLQVKSKPASYPPRPSSQTQNSKRSQGKGQQAADTSSEFDREESSAKG